MASVWYTGTASKRIITSEQWTLAGFTQPDTVWSKANGYSIPESEFTAPELTFLGQQSGFQTGAADGPRPGAAIVANPGRPVNEERLSLALAGLSATYAPLGSGRPKGATVALIGDSFTAQNAPPGGYGPIAGAQWYPANGWWDWADIFLGKRTKRAGTFGVGGQTTAQILARITDVTSLSPKPAYCVVQGGTNDTNLNVASATTIANQQATCEALLAAGIIPILTSIPPVPYTSPGQLASVSAVLAWQKLYARQTSGVIYCDWRRYTAKPDGTWRTGMSDDTIHPNSVGCAVLGKALADTLSPLIPAVDTLGSVNNDPKLINPNPTLQGTGGTPLGAGVTGVTPDSWRCEAWLGDTVVTAVSSVEEEALTGERSWKIVLSGGSIQLRTQPATGWAAGDQVYAECEFEFDPTQPFSNIDKINLQIDIPAGATGSSQDPNAPSSDAANHSAASWMKGVLRTPVFTIPAGSTALSAKFIVRRVTGTTPAATFKVRRFALKKV